MSVGSDPSQRGRQAGLCPGALAAAGWSQDGARAVPSRQSWGLWGHRQALGARQVCWVGAESRDPGTGDFTGSLPWDGAWYGAKRAGERLLHRERGWSCCPDFVCPLVGEGGLAVTWPFWAGLGAWPLCSAAPGDGRRRLEQAHGVSCSCGMCDLLPLLCGHCFGHRP